MTQSEIAESVKKVIHIQLGCSYEDIKGDAELEFNLGADTLDIVELILALEEEFDITLPEEECEPIKTVSELTELVTKHLKGSR
jgi:acyl carrier protein